LKILDLTADLSLDHLVRDAHAGTRIETPAYLFSDGKRIDQFGLESFVADSVLLDLTDKEPGQPIDDEDLEGAEERAGIGLREGEVVLLHTGREGSQHDDNVPTPHAYLSENGAEYLEFKRPFMVGTDAPSLDPNGSKELSAHSILMRAGILVLESLCNLEKIQQSRFRLLALPLKLKGSTSPVRAVAILEEI
jgi:kynurenine formamidase